MRYSKNGLIHTAVALALVTAAGVLGASSISPHTASATAVPEGSVFVASTAQRLFDTRDGTGLESGGGMIAADSTVSVQITGAVVPAGAVGVAMNLTYVDAHDTGFITIYPDDEPMPGTSNLNKVGAGPVANYVTARLSATGRLAVHNNGGATHLIGDVVGYYVAGAGAPGPRGAEGPQGPQGVRPPGRSWDQRLRDHQRRRHQRPDRARDVPDRQEGVGRQLRVDLPRPTRCGAELADIGRDRLDG